LTKYQEFENKLTKVLTLFCKSSYFCFMISFDNTEVAFKSKSNKDLNRAYWLFKMVGSPTFVKFGKCATNAAFSIHLPIQGIVKKTIFKQFCGGESIKECNSTIDNLSKYNIGTILDYSVEGKTTESDFDATVKEIIATVEKSKSNEKIPFAVFKVTGIARFDILEKANMGIDKLSVKDRQHYDKMVSRVDSICKAAFTADTSVFIDAEETWIQETIDTVAFEMMKKYNQKTPIVYNTLQMYRHDRLNFLQRMIEESKSLGLIYGVKLVRGAYMEKERARAKDKGYPSPIQPNKKATDTDFDKALEILVENFEHVAICAGTHNEESSLKLVELIDEKGLDKTSKRIYFAQLLGMSDHISYNLSNAKYNVGKYVPYGPVKEVMPYLLRRADENTSVAGQTSRELALILKEKARRKI